MKDRRVFFHVFLAAALALTGCAKKSNEPANPSGTGFETVSGTEDLSQLPQASGTSQQSAVEVLPVETSPVTQNPSLSSNNSGLPSAYGVTEAASGEALSYQQKIQTALKNAGFYNGPIDGKIGPASRRAIEVFQKQHSLKVDGKVGPKTWILLEPFLTTSRPAVKPSTGHKSSSTAPAPSSSPVS